MKTDKGIIIVLVFVFILFITLIVISTIALVKSNDAKNNIPTTTFPNIFPLSGTIPQIIYGSVTIPLYARNFQDQFDIFLNSPNQGFCQWPSDGKSPFVCNNPQPVDGSLFRVSRLSPPPINSQKTLLRDDDILKNFIENGQFTLIDPTLKDTDSTSFDKCKVQSWSANDGTTVINGKNYKSSAAPYTFVVLKPNQIISQTFQITDSCGYRCAFHMNANDTYGGSIIIRIVDSTNQIRHEKSIYMDTIKPGALLFQWTHKETPFFLNPGSYTLQISGESQTTNQSSGITDISISPYLFNQFAIELPVQYKTVPFIQCTLSSDITQHVSDYMKSVFLQLYTDACIIENGYANYFTSSVSVNNPSFFTVDILGPWKNLETVCAVQLTLNWIAIGITK